MEPSVNIIYPPHSRQAGSEPEAESSTTPFSRPFIRRRNLLKLRHRYMRRSPSNSSTNSVDERISTSSDTLGPELPVNKTNGQHVVHSDRSEVRVLPSHIALSRRRHLMEARGALNFPPVVTTVCLINVLCFYFREKFGFYKVEDVYVNWHYVWEERQYWRLFVAQFFHFNTLNMIINSGTLFTIGRYLERKVTFIAMFAIVLAMGAFSQIIFILIHPYCCENKPRTNDFTYGFGNIIYSLRVLLAYALEPRNYERDLVFGLYPMVVSASHAPWQPALDLLIFKFVLPELCITGQLSGVLAGFLVTVILLLWPTKGVYIAKPPYYWTLMGTADPDERVGEDESESGNEEEFWKILTYTDTSFLLPTPTGSKSTIALPPEPHPNNDNDQPRTEPRQDGKLEGTQSSSSPPFVKSYKNSMIQKSEEFKSTVSKIISHPVESIFELVTSISGNRNSKQGRQQRQHHENKVRRSNKTQVLHRTSKSMLSGSSLDASFLTAGKVEKSSVEQIRRRNGNTVIDDMSSLQNPEI